MEDSTDNILDTTIGLGMHSNNISEWVFVLQSGQAWESRNSDIQLGALSVGRRLSAVFGATQFLITSGTGTGQRDLRLSGTATLDRARKL